ncbi:hypothetical protein TWF696_002221 [Orbilia brochopaga]|uniref:PIN domain-containing protein n=1 Tax=Orbilia brochopaga TaxID=3140254 RepID=A0AAV9U3S2_9PEZI
MLVSHNRHYTEKTPLVGSSGTLLCGTTGRHVSPVEFYQGKLGNVLLDTSVVSPMLDSKPLCPWFNLLSQNSRLAVCQFTIAEYMCSRRVGSKIVYDDVIQRLQDHKVEIIGGLLTSPEVTKLACEIICMKQKSSFTKPTNSPDYDEALRKANDDQWAPGIEKSRWDLALACEAHFAGLPFLHADQKFHKFFERQLLNKGITTYCLERSQMTV